MRRLRAVRTFEAMSDDTGDSQSNMRRAAFMLKVKPERIEEYKVRHREVWPEMLAALREAGWSNYSLFMRDDGLLIGYVETEDFDQALAAMAHSEVNARWQTEMAPFFEHLDDKHPDEGLIRLEEVFHLD